MPYEGSLNAINNSDVESINILKDASAAALYEARGANGVIIIKSNYKVGDINFEDLEKEKDLVYFDKKYATQTVQHCHIELPVSRAYMEHGKVVIISSTQIPHITRRVCGQALGIPKNIVEGVIVPVGIVT